MLYYKLELGKVVCEVVDNELPLDVTKNFTASKDVHSCNTREIKKLIIFLLFVSKFVIQLAFHGTTFWSKLGKNMETVE